MLEFWGIEVKAGQKHKVHIEFNKVLHLSQASLGDSKKGKGKENESVPLFLNVDGQKLVIGTLSPNKCNQMTFDLVFEKEFELSHNWANGSVYFCGYTSLLYPEEDESDSDDESSEEEEDIPLVAQENGIPEQKDIPSKPSTDNAKSKGKVVEPIKEMKAMEVDTDSDDDEDDSEDDTSSESEDDSAEKNQKPSVKKMADGSDEEEDDDSSDEEDDDSSDEEDDENSKDEDNEISEDEDNENSEDEDNESSDDEDEDESSDEEDEATPKKAEQNKKRPAPPAGSDTKTPTGKKAKLVTPQKIGGEGKKTGVHIATPYPSKQAGKTSANNDKSKQQTPASDGQVSCGSCSKLFKSDQARDSHSKAKHGAA